VGGRDRIPERGREKKKREISERNAEKGLEGKRVNVRCMTGGQGILVMRWGGGIGSRGGGRGGQCELDLKGGGGSPCCGGVKETNS